jgi:hypothetical protein
LTGEKDFEGFSTKRKKPDGFHLAFSLLQNLVDG